jgi:protein-S-isoprenylcysteine O-methyltransferase Ste14
MPMSQKEDPELVTTGPYSKVRHPIYTGIISAMIGTALALSLLWLIVAAILGGYFIFSATREEKFMASQFPATYPAYKRSTRMLIPYIL